ncbi:peptidyl-tRNA hydrolase [Desulfonispora thiosulfatigenes DSM 11270]|uniref:Peptidyl-tRNA hydrolase n=1 Tax=Desulfonispora thiosulfatigenes DSM 11270 TaxID=656914 RepID=A0A1W1UZJ6_DESTI|nr:aminoacyl-tRNA hydrolase [Desulfonispora thiosulfatigenes]SMB86499.1 peptidyl-tRNA hydrolase [Desulfonispora thiosulfatigenes DSM 11270]
MFLIIGLGNPGDKYKDTKHNVGFLVIDKIADKLGVKVEKKQARSLVESTYWDGKKVLLVKPQTYMNLSGEAVRELINYYDNIENFIIVYDDLDLDIGQLRFRRDGSAGGHNGLKSIISHLHSSDIERLKIGIGKPTKGYPVKDYVLQRFSKEEKEIMDSSIEKAVNGIELWLKEDISVAMNNFNKK